MVFYKVRENSDMHNYYKEYEKKRNRLLKLKKEIEDELQQKKGLEGVRFERIKKEKDGQTIIVMNLGDIYGSGRYEEITSESDIIRKFGSYAIVLEGSLKEKANRYLEENTRNIRDRVEREDRIGKKGKVFSGFGNKGDVEYYVLGNEGIEEQVKGVTRKEFREVFKEEENRVKVKQEIKDLEEILNRCKVTKQDSKYLKQYINSLDKELRDNKIEEVEFKGEKVDMPRRLTLYLADDVKREVK